MMIDMLGYLEHRFSTPGEARLVVAATRHEDGGWSSPESLEYHRQRGRLLHSLAGAESVGQLEFSDDVDAADPRETGYALIDVPLALVEFAGSIAGIVSLWLSARPRKKKDSVPGVRLELPGKTLIVSGEITEQDRRRLVEAFLASG